MVEKETPEAFIKDCFETWEADAECYLKGELSMQRFLDAIKADAFKAVRMAREEAEEQGRQKG